MPPIEPQALLDPLRCILLQAGAEVRRLYYERVTATEKADGSPVTAADIRANELLQRALMPLVPGAAWLSEENCADPSRVGREWAWVVDPLDGTREFVRGIPEFALSVGLVRHGQPMLGGVLNPVTGEGAVGAVGGPASFWGMIPAAAVARSLETALVSISRSEVEDGSIRPFLSLVGETLPVGSVAYKLLRVAAGVEDLTFSVQPKSEWDVCGGVALLHAAGKSYRRLDGETLRFNQSDARIRSGAVAGPVALVEALVKSLRAAKDEVATEEPAWLKARFAAALRGMVTYLVEEGYHGFNIVRHAGRFFAIAQTLGPVDLSRVDPQALGEHRRARMCVEAGSVSELKQAVDNLGYRPTPELVESGHLGFNILAFRTGYYAIAQNQGCLDLARITDSELSELVNRKRCLVGDSPEALKRAIAELGYYPIPQLLEENYQGFNLVAYEDKVHAVARSLGPLNLPEVSADIQRKHMAQGTWRVGESLVDVKRALSVQDAERPSPAAAHGAARDGETRPEPVGLKRIRMDITDNCNLRCSICTIHDQRPKTDLHPMDFDRFRRHCHGALASLRIAQIGNIAEPLLHPRFDDFVRFIRSETEGEILIQSNGLLLERHIPVLEETRCTLNVSIDSLDRERYRRIRGGNLDTLLRGLEKIDAARVKVVLTPVWMRQTLDEYDAFLEFSQQHRFILTGPLMCIRESGGMILRENIEESLWFDKAAVRLWKKKIDRSPKEWVWLHGRFAGPAANPACTAHHDDLMILADGICTLCFKQPIGNVLESPLKDLWGGERAGEFRRGIDEGTSDACRLCDYRSICLRPSFEDFRNHVSAPIYECLSAETRRALTFDSPMADQEQKETFLRDVSRSFQICDRSEYRPGSGATAGSTQGGGSHRSASTTVETSDPDGSKATTLRFSLDRCVAFDGGAQDGRLLTALLQHVQGSSRTFVLYGSRRLCEYILRMCPWVGRLIPCLILTDAGTGSLTLAGVPVIGLDEIPTTVDTVLLCETRFDELVPMARALRPEVRIVTFDALVEVDRSAIPSRAWVPHIESIYPIEIPAIRFLPGQDMILLDLPARTIAQMPAGFGYVHTSLAKTGIRLQTVDCDIILYHRFHQHRIMDGVSDIVTPNGYHLPEDPWQPVHYLLWEKSEFLEFFQPEMEEIARGLIAARPRVIGISLQQANLSFTREIVRRVRAGLPDVVIVVGGMSCLQPGAARMVMPEADYTVVGEADLIVGPLVQALVRGERPRDLPGVWSRHDSPDRSFTPGPLPHDLDALDFPRYEWTDIQLYRNWNGYQLTPVIGSPGCHWAKCRFCGERFHWRSCSPERVADELEWLSRQGFTNFVFNESDLHGEPELILQLCDEILRRGLQINMTAQLRCHPKTDDRYYRRLYQAGFRCLRFGVDGGSSNVLKRERKGYTKELIRENLRASAAAGIFNEVNLVIGIPGETDEDIDETIAFFSELKPHIGRLAYINPLMLFRGSDYWDHPEEYGIRFGRDKEELYGKYLVAIPDHEWFSTDPYIDKAVRYARLKRVVSALQSAGVPLGDFAHYTTERVESHIRRDAAKAEAAGASASSSETGRTHNGYQLKKGDNCHYAVPPEMTGLDLGVRRIRYHPGILSSDTEEGLLQLIDRTTKRQPESRPPEPVSRGYKGYDIYACDGIHVACEQGRGAPDLELIRSNRFGRWFSGEGLEDVTHLIDRMRGAANGAAKSRVLFVCDTTPDRVRAILDRLPFRDVTLLVSSARPQAWPRYPTIDLAGRGRPILEELKARRFDLAIVPYEDKLDGEPWEKHIATFAPKLLAAYPDGSLRLYRRNHLTRLVYNAAYLRSMLQFVPSLEGARALEVGCSDGLTCDLLVGLGAAHVTGVDVLATVGLLYPNTRVEYHCQGAEALEFPDSNLDLCYSIATFEHVVNPAAALAEMARVLRPGGIGYVQAGPLYHSPFGHHMFGYFDDYPWIHLRLSKEEILEHCQQRGIEARIRADKGQSAEEYVYGMINGRHVNGRLLGEYAVQEFSQCGQVEVLHFAVSREGQHLVTDAILNELAPLTPDDLTSHGFELVFRKR